MKAQGMKVIDIAKNYRLAVQPFTVYYKRPNNEPGFI
jgi:N-acetyl-gamma-glutamylphosphate reductase